MRGGFYSIRDMAAVYRTTLRALRFYEQEGLLSPLRIDRQRIYSPADRVRLELILKGKRLGFTLTEIKKIIDGMRSMASMDQAPEPSDFLSVLGRSELERRIGELEIERDGIESAISELEKQEQRLRQ